MFAGEELTEFLESLEGKTKKTIMTYKTQYNKLASGLHTTEVTSVSEKKVIELIKQYPNPNNQQALYNVAILLRKMKKLPYSILTKERDKNILIVKEHTRQKNKQLETQLPTLNDLLEYTDDLFDNGKYTDFIINYLLLNYQVRNKDLNFTITNRKKHMTDIHKNYIWFDVKTKKAVYLRRDYKTEKTYGEKKHIITDKEFITAVRRVLACQKHNEECGVFIPNEDQLGYYIRKATYNEIGEGAYLKIIIRALAKEGNIDKLKEISDNRGTSVDTLIESYNINIK